MANTIKLKRGSGSDPGSSDLSVGELAIRTDEGKIFTKKDDGSVAEISGGGSGVTDGDKGDITVSNSGGTWLIDTNAIDNNNLQDDCVGNGQIADNVVSEEKLKISNSGSNGQFLQKQSGNTGGFTWSDLTGSGASLTSLYASELTSGTVAAARLDTATTQSAGNNSTKIATTAYADTAIANLIDSSPSALNTLNELASALGDDANFSTTVTNSIATKLPLAGGTLTGALSGTTFSGTHSSGNIGLEIHGTGSGIGAQTKYHNDHGVNYVGVSGNTTGDMMVYNESNTALRFYTNSAERLTIAANGAATFSGTCTATTFSGSGASLTNLPAPTITANNGGNSTQYITFVDTSAGGSQGLETDSALTYNPSTNALSCGSFSGDLNATNLASGTVPTARLGSGTASSSTFLRGDGSWASAGGTSTGETYVRLNSSGSASDYGDNTSAGYQAGNSLASGGGENSFFGYQAGKNVTTGDFNVTMGVKAGENLSTGGECTLIGTESGRNLSDAGHTTAIGYRAIGYGSCSATGITAVGHEALKMQTSGNYNTGLGYQALKENSSGQSNTAIGYKSITGTSNNVQYNTAVGAFTLDDSGVTGNNNTAIGYGALTSAVTGSDNTGVGYQVLYSNTGGRDNTAFGKNSLFACSSGEENVAVGSKAGEDLTTGKKNIYIGYNAAEGATDGDNNIVIGHDATASSTTVSSEITLGNSNTAKFRIPGLNFIIKDSTNTPGHILTVDSNDEAHWAAPAAASLPSGKSYLDDGPTNQSVLGGAQAGANLNNSSGYNIVFGYYAANALTSSQNNVVIGYKAANQTTTQGRHVIIGSKACEHNALGEANVFIGYEAGFRANGAERNVGVGSYCFNSNSLSSAAKNTGIGDFVFQNLTTGDDNTACGGRSGMTITTGSNNTCLGYGAEPSSATASNEVIVGNSSVTKFSIPGLNFSLKDTTATNDYVLTVDSNGDCGWEAAGGTSTGETYVKLKNASGAASDTGKNTYAGYTAGNALASGSDENSFYGLEAGYSCTTGESSVFLGAKCGRGTTDSGFSVAIGADCYRFGNISGTVALGYKAAGGTSFAGSNNTALGYQTLLGCTSGSNNTAVGREALEANENGHSNTAVGYLALTANTSAQQNTAVGEGALKTTTTGGYNSAFGYDALAALTTGEQNTAIGRYSLVACTTGSRNSTLGNFAGFALTTGGYNTFVGEAAGQTSTTGANNTAVGSDAFRYGAGAENTCLGRQAGDVGSFVGSNNIIIGYQADPSAANASNEITLGNSSITKFRIPGINFVVKDNGGTPSDGQVLTADGNGEASWEAAGSPAVADGCIYENSQTISNNYTMTTNKNGMSAGPITVSATVTIPSGSSWSIV